MDTDFQHLDGIWFHFIYISQEHYCFHTKSVRVGVDKVRASLWAL